MTGVRPGWRESRGLLLAFVRSCGTEDALTFALDVPDAVFVLSGDK